MFQCMIQQYIYSLTFCLLRSCFRDLLFQNVFIYPGHIVSDTLGLPLQVLWTSAAPIWLRWKLGCLSHRREILGNSKSTNCPSLGCKNSIKSKNKQTNKTDPPYSNARCHIFHSPERIDIRVYFPTRKDLPELSKGDIKMMDVGKIKDACRLTFRSLQHKNCICPYRGHTGNKNKWLYFNLATFSATNETALNAP